MSTLKKLNVEPDIRIDKSNYGTELMESMLLEQYQSSTNLKAYINIFMKELNLLFKATDDTYFGRLVVNAVGYQLDVIGKILQQSRNMVLTEDPFFGFQGATGADGMADEATPLDGGIFKDGGVSHYEISPLSDDMYRRVLLARGMIVSQEVLSVSRLYEVLYVLLPKSGNIQITEKLTHTEVIMSAATVSNLELSMLHEVRGWLIHAGERITFTAT